MGGGMGRGAGIGREAARALWPMVLQMWDQHPLVLMIILGVMAVIVAYVLSQLWEIVRPPPLKPHEVYRPPRFDDDDRSKKGGSGRSTV